MNPHKILIVEDNPIVAEDLKIHVMKCRFKNVTIAYSGEDAIEHMESELVDIVFMDINLGRGINGIDCVKKINTGHPVLVIYVTAHSDNSTLIKAKETQPFGFIFKPIQEDEIETMLDRILRFLASSR